MKERRINVVDPKWAHPEISDVGLWANPAFVVPAQTTYSEAPGMTAEQQEKDQSENAGASLIQSILPAKSAKWQEWYYGGEWKEYYTEHGCPEEPDAKPVKILVRIPKDIGPKEKLPVHIHVAGGAYCSMGTAESGIVTGADFMTGCPTRFIFISYTYRLAPSHPWPAAINDGHAAYMWVLEHAAEIHANKNKIVFSGVSTGGHMSLCLGFRLKKYNYHGYMPRGIIALVPVMDDISYKHSCCYTFRDENDIPTNWDSDLNRWAMRLWLGGLYGEPGLKPEAIPARASLEDVKGYPPVWLPACAEFDPGRDADYRLASLLHQAGVFCDIHVWGGISHTGCGFSEAELSKRIWNIIWGRCGTQ